MIIKIIVMQCLCCVLIIKLAMHQRDLCTGISGEGQLHPAILPVMQLLLLNHPAKPYEVLLAASLTFDVGESILPLSLL